jgi:hypothetical protein
VILNLILPDKLEGEGEREATGHEADV